MTAQAQNALLKTIEEPPSYAIIMLLTTNQEAFLPTILSRCVQLKLKPLQDSVVKTYLMESQGISEVKAEIYAAFARELRKSHSSGILRGFSADVYGASSYAEASERYGYYRALDYIKKLKDENLDIYECLDFMQLWYRMCDV